MLSREYEKSKILCVCPNVCLNEFLKCLFSVFAVKIIFSKLYLALLESLRNTILSYDFKGHCI